MSLGLHTDFYMNLMHWWNKAERFPGGKAIFNAAVGIMIPYTGSVKPKILKLVPGHSEVLLEDRRSVRNHLHCIHAIALMNIGEYTTGLAVHSALPPNGRGILTHLEIDFLRKARGPITAKADFDLKGRTESFETDQTADLVDAKGELVARVSARWKVDFKGKA
jgi:acyl-coenzyme A thioesterase PaaI-like protein